MRWLAAALLTLLGCGESLYDVGGLASSSGAATAGGAASGGGDPGQSGAAAGGDGNGGANGMGGAAAGNAGAPQGGAPQGGCAATERCNGVDDDCDTLVDEEAACPDDCKALVGPAGRFTFCNRRLTFSSATAFCTELGLRLPVLDTADKNTLAKEATLDRTPDEIGFYLDARLSDAGNWQWNDGREFWRGDDLGAPVLGMYSNWLEYNPTGDTAERCAEAFVAASFRGGRWGDQDCDKARAVLCEDRAR